LEISSRARERPSVESATFSSAFSVRNRATSVEAAVYKLLSCSSVSCSFAFNCETNASFWSSASRTGSVNCERDSGPLVDCGDAAGKGDGWTVVSELLVLFWTQPTVLTISKSNVAKDFGTQFFIAILSAGSGLGLPASIDNGRRAISRQQAFPQAIGVFTLETNAGFYGYRNSIER
jgi:hypothetical protein